MPPLFPFPLLFTAKRTLKISLPKGVPKAGVFDRITLSSDNSFFNEGNFLINLLAYDLKVGVGIIL